MLHVAVDAPAGATAFTVGGYTHNAVAMGLGDYVGGDGRPHIVTAAATLAAGGGINGGGTIYADGMGTAVVGFQPPLSKAVPAGTPLVWPVTGMFRLTSDDAGQNETQVGDVTDYTLDFVEDLP